MTGEIMLDVFIKLVLILLLTFEKSTESTLGGSEAELVLIVLKYYYLRAKARDHVRIVSTYMISEAARVTEICMQINTMSLPTAVELSYMNVRRDRREGERIRLF